MATSQQTAANRRNASQSTGPRTPEGKARSSHNALSHGIFAEDLVLDRLGESEDALLDLRQNLLDHYQPQGPEEDDLVEAALACQWRIKRVRRAETARIDLCTAHQDQIAFETAIAAKLLTPEPGRERLAQSRALALAVIGDAKLLNQLCLYESRLQRMLERTRAELHKLQKNRKNEPNSPGSTDSEICVDPCLSVAQNPNVKNEPNFGPTESNQTPRNAPCPCGSGIKYKRCCGAGAPPVLNTEALSA